MHVNRRRFLTASAAAAIAGPSAIAATPSGFGLNSMNLGLRPGSSADQTQLLQSAIDQAATTRVPLMLAAGVYRVASLNLPAGANIIGIRGATHLAFTGGTALFSANVADTISLSGLTLDGVNLTLPEGGGLINLTAVKNLLIADCTVIRAAGHGIMLWQCDGEVSGNTILGAADTALFSRDGFGLTIANNIIRNSGNGGIRVWQTDIRDDGSTIVDNRIQKTLARAGGTGQNGNAINIFQANNVIVRGNHINEAAFSAIRGNAASNIQIIGNNCSSLDEVAIYSEFAFEAAVISDNLVDGAEIGISVTNFNDGGRLSTVHGNLIRNLGRRRPHTPIQSLGIGIAVEADTAVAGNTIDGAINTGIRLGWGQYLRDVAVSGNVVRGSNFGVGVSVVAGAGAAVISGNIISGAKRAAVVGMEYQKAVSGDLTKGGVEAYPQLKVADNQVS